jgi:hypothetical protein
MEVDEVVDSAREELDGHLQEACIFGPDRKSLRSEAVCWDSIECCIQDCALGCLEGRWLRVVLGIVWPTVVNERAGRVGNLRGDLRSQAQMSGSLTHAESSATAAVRVLAVPMRSSVKTGLSYFCNLR